MRLQFFSPVGVPLGHVLLQLLVCASLLPHQITAAQDTTALAGTALLNLQGDLSAEMVAGIDKFLMREIEQSVAERQQFWKRDFSSPEAYAQSVQTNRERFRKAIGATDVRVRVSALEYVSTTTSPAKVAETSSFSAYAVRWPVFEDVQGEGLLLQPKTPPVARVIAIPDADQTPEMLVGLAPGLAVENQFARQLAENGCEVLVPTLIDRQDTWSGNPALNRFTNLPHREWIYRQAYEMGRHIIGYEVQKVLAGVDWFAAAATNAPSQNPQRIIRIGVAGYGEGGLVAFYAAALDRRIEAALVSGYFNSRQRVWEEPIYRNVFGLLHEFGDAEIASLIAPRALIVEHSPALKISGPPPARTGRGGAASGKWETPDFNSVESEVNRAKNLFPKSSSFQMELIHGNEGTAVGPGSHGALTAFLRALGNKAGKLNEPAGQSLERRQAFDSAERQKRQFDELVRHTQRLLQVSERTRDEGFWRKIKATSPEAWASGNQANKEAMWNELIGRFPPASLPVNPRSRKVYDRPTWTGYEVVLDVWPDVYAWGYLLLPKDLKPGERRPVVVCQHGLEGVPADTVNGPNEPGYGAYKSFSARLAERGFVVFAPHNPYRGVDKFRVLQRKANPLKASIFSVILAQHDRILDWLSELPFVDPKRIGFYGLSYGGKTAMRVPSLLDRYCLSICSADFNEWAKKCTTIDSTYSYLYTIEYDMYEFDLGHTFSYAEMAALVAPRPFMVERGHHDGVAPDEWVAYEYAKVRRFYAKLGIPERTQIEFFDGPHTINGMGTFQFLHKHLNWPEPK